MPLSTTGSPTGPATGDPPAVPPSGRQSGAGVRAVSPGITLGHRVEYYALRGVVGALRALPWERACRLGERIGTLGYAPLKIRRDVVERQVAAAFPEWPRERVLQVARQSFAHLGRTAVEAALLPGLGANGVLRLVETVQNWTALERAVSGGHGVVLVTGHLGNWELAGAYVAARGVPIDVIAREQANPLFDTYLTQTREALAMSVMYDRDAVRRVPRSLRAGHAVAFVSDQGALGLASTFVPFFGRPAKTPRGAAVFALRFNLPVLFVTALRQPTGRYRVVVEEIPVDYAADRDLETDAIVARYTAALERWVRAAPEQYFWQHRRWRRQPPDTPPELREP
jgi:KDO2-lipid IV(A) lauroyltransferase